MEALDVLDPMVPDNAVDLDLATDGSVDGAGSSLTTMQTALGWGLVVVGSLQLGMVAYSGISRWRQRRRIDALSEEERDEYHRRMNPTYELAYGRILPAMEGIHQQGGRIEDKLDALSDKVDEIHDRGIRIEDGVTTLSQTTDDMYSQAKRHFKDLLAQSNRAVPEKDPEKKAA